MRIWCALPLGNEDFMPRRFDLCVTSAMSASSLLKELWFEAPLKPPSLDRISNDLEPSSVEAASLIFAHTAWYLFLQLWIFCKLYTEKACWCPWPLQQIPDNETLGWEEETTMWLTLQFIEHLNLQEGNNYQLSQLFSTARIEREKTPSVCIRNYDNIENSLIALSRVLLSYLASSRTSSLGKRSLSSPNTMNGRNQKSNCTWKNVIERR